MACVPGAAQPTLCDVTALRLSVPQLYAINMLYLIYFRYFYNSILVYIIIRFSQLTYLYYLSSFYRVIVLRYRITMFNSSLRHRPLYDGARIPFFIVPRAIKKYLLSQLRVLGFIVSSNYLSILLPVIQVFHASVNVPAFLSYFLYITIQQLDLCPFDGSFLNPDIFLESQNMSLFSDTSQ